MVDTKGFFMAYIYLAQWQWVDKGTGNMWYPPNFEQSTGILDLRSPVKCAEMGGANPGYGIFTYETEQPGIGYLLGQNIGANVNLATKNEIIAALGLGEGIVADTVDEVIWELCNPQADPEGVERMNPIQPNSRGLMELYLGPFGLVKSEPYRPFLHPGVPGLFRKNLRKIAREIIIGDVTLATLRKYLTTVAMRTRSNWRDFVPEAFPNLTPLQPTTMIYDGFQRANNTNLASGGNSPQGYSWSQVWGTGWEIMNEEAILDVAAGANNYTARLNADLSTDDQYVQVTIGTRPSIVTWDNITGVMGRKDSTTTNTFYGVDYSNEDASGAYWRTVKYNSGAGAVLGTNTNATQANVGDLFKMTINGSSVVRLRNGSVQNTATDTSITANLRTGLSGYRSGSVTDITGVDNFEAGDYWDVLVDLSGNFIRSPKIIG